MKVDPSLVEAVSKVLSEATGMVAASQHALQQASKQKPGSEEYHKWMTVHHKAAAHGSTGANQDFHEAQSESHADKAGDDEDFHNGDSHHWSRF